MILFVLDLRSTSSWIGARTSSTDVALDTASDSCITGAIASELVKMDSELEKDHHHEERYGVSPTDYADPGRTVQEKGIGMGDAIDIYGDLATAENYGYVSRGYFGKDSYRPRFSTDFDTASNRGIFNSSLSVAPSVPVFSSASVVPSPKPALSHSFWGTP